jgi:hypothetical protein
MTNDLSKVFKMNDYEAKPDMEDEYNTLPPKNPDFEGVQDGIRRAAEIGEQALEELSGFARQSQHPRNYEAMTELLKAVIMANEKLIDIKQKQKELDGNRGPTHEVHNNTMIVGSSKDALEYIRAMKEKKND